VGALARYRRVLSAPGVAWLQAAAVLARMPIGIDSLAIVLFVQARTGSFARAGAVAGAFGIALAITTPLQGRLIDRHGHARVVLPLAAGHAAALAGLVVLGFADAPLAALMVVGAAAGATLPPVGAVIRPLLPELLADTPELLGTAYALDSVLIEIVFIVGPLLTAVMVSAVSPAGSLLVACALVLIGTAALVATPASRGWRSAPVVGKRHPLGPLGAPGVQTIVLVTLPLSVCLGLIEVAIPAFATSEGRRSDAGVLLALWSVGSAIGGLTYGARHQGGAVGAVYVRLVLLFPLTIVPLLAASSIGVMLPLALVAGLGIAPVFAAANQVVADVAPAGSATEAFTWPVTAISLGIAAGTALSGVIVEADGWRTAVAVGVLAALLAAGVAAARRLTLRPRAAA
jgi:MFS family permease